MHTHQAIDRRSLDLHRLVTEKIRADPGLARQARATLAHWLESADPRSQPYLREWQRLFDAGIETALAAATEDSERGAAMRQSSPFCGVLTNQERFRFSENGRSRSQSDTRRPRTPDPCGGRDHEPIRDRRGRQPVSLEADRYPKDRPDLADLIDRAIGELSPFEQRFGCHAQGVGPETAVFLVLSGKSGGALRRTAHL